MAAAPTSIVVLGGYLTVRMGATAAAPASAQAPATAYRTV
jgi:hypothetical protein